MALFLDYYGTTCHSSVKWSDPGDFLKAQFVIFRCLKYVKKGYMEMRK